MESKDIGATQIAMSEKGQNWQHWHLHLARLNAVALSAEYGCGLMKSSDVYMQVKGFLLSDPFTPVTNNILLKQLGKINIDYNKPSVECLSIFHSIYKSVHKVTALTNH